MKYEIIMSDPPWKFETRGKDGDGKGPEYPTMKLLDMAALPVSSMIADNALLCMWAYDPLLFKAPFLAKRWGFKTYATVLFRWFKTTDDQLRLFDPTPKPGYGLGYHTRGGACEEMLLFRRGRALKVLDHSIRKEFFAPLREHSRKPDEVADWIVKLYGDRPRAEMFARTRRPGWDQIFSNEADKFQ